MTQAQADNNAIFFLLLFLLWFGYHWLFVADFPGLPGVKRYQIIWGLVVDRFSRKKRKIGCRKHVSHYRNQGGLWLVVEAARCPYCKERKKW